MECTAPFWGAVFLCLIKFAIVKSRQCYAQNIPSDDCDEITRFGVYRVGPNTQNAYLGNMGGIVLALPWDANRQQQISASPDGTTIYILVNALAIT